MCTGSRDGISLWCNSSARKDGYGACSWRWADRAQPLRRPSCAAAFQWSWQSAIYRQCNLVPSLAILRTTTHLPSISSLTRQAGKILRICSALLELSCAPISTSALTDVPKALGRSSSRPLKMHNPPSASSMDTSGTDEHWKSARFVSFDDWYSQHRLKCIYS